MKVHFAGYISHKKSIEVAGVQYILDSFWDLQPMGPEKAQRHIDGMNSKKGSIIDSGLFTLMFGANARDDLDEAFFDDWQKQFIAYIKAYRYKHIIVECDVQKKISPEYAWDLRRRLRWALPNIEQINVYHLEDGNPDKLIKWSRYIAISIPELRRNVSEKERLRIMDYISRKAILAGKKVHLLGCTQPDLMSRYRYCHTCDSTSWHVERWAQGFKEGGIPALKDIRDGINNFKFNNKTNRLDGENLTKPEQASVWSARFHLIHYAQLAGDQS